MKPIDRAKALVNKPVTEVQQAADQLLEAPATGDYAFGERSGGYKIGNDTGPLGRYGRGAAERGAAEPGNSTPYAYETLQFEKKENGKMWVAQVIQMPDGNSVRRKEFFDPRMAETQLLLWKQLARQGQLKPKEPSPREPSPREPS